VKYPFRFAIVVILSVAFAATQAWAAGSVVRHDVVLSDAACGHGSVTLTDRGKLFSGTYSVCGRETLTFLWRPQAGHLMLSTAGGARLGEVHVNVAKTTWSADAVVLPILSSTWGREINVIAEVLVKARPILKRPQRSPHSELQDDPWGDDPWGGGGDDPDCMGHYMTYQYNSCVPCTVVRWYYADSRYASYTNGWKPNGSNNCACPKEIGCTNL
jgi:hypothetical protein